LEIDMYNRYDHEDPLVFPFLKDGYGCFPSLRTEREREKGRRGRHACIDDLALFFARERSGERSFLAVCIYLAC